MATAAVRSSSAMPTDLKSVISSSEVRPASVPTSTAPSSPSRCDGSISPQLSGATRSPGSVRHAAIVSTKTRDRRTAYIEHTVHMVRTASTLSKW